MNVGLHHPCGFCQQSLTSSVKCTTRVDWRRLSLRICPSTSKTTYQTYYYYYHHYTTNTISVWRPFFQTRTPPVKAHRAVVTHLQFPIQVCFPWLSVCRPHPASQAHFRHRRPYGLNSSIDEPGSASSLSGPPVPLFWNRTSGISATGIFKGRICPSHHPTISVEALKGAQSSNPNQWLLHPPLDSLNRGRRFFHVSPREPALWSNTT